MPLPHLLRRFLKRGKSPSYNTSLELVPLFDYFAHSTAPVQGDWEFGLNLDTFHCECGHTTFLPVGQGFGYCRGCMSLIEKPHLGELSEDQQQEKEYYEGIVLSNRLDII